MSSLKGITQEEFDNELAHSKETTEIIINELNNEYSRKETKEETVLKDRQFFIDYFNEMHNDERQDWLQFEHENLKKYDNSMKLISRYVKLLSQPYFGKVSFKDPNSTKSRQCYLGIYPLMKGVLPVIVDWRAPVSALYYESEPGLTTYDIPNSGTRTVELTEKKRFAFKDGNLVTAQNIKMPSDDEFLTEILSESSSDHLKVIVSSLQKDQNKIVRDFVDGVHIIAGCAGSGKSSVAMHKIAYIMFNFRDKLENKDIVVLSPNAAFSAYISHILPDLGEDNVNSLTQEELVYKILNGLDVSFSSRENSMERMLTDEGHILSDNVKFKNSMLFRDLLVRYVKYYQSTCFVAEDIKYKLNADEEEKFEIKKDDIDFLFYDHFESSPVSERIDLITNYLLMKNHLRGEFITDYIKNQLISMMKPLNMEEIYRHMFTDKFFLSTLSKDIAEKLPKDLTYYNITPLTWEDGVAIAYIASLLTGAEENSNVFYLFCDEAQDLSPVMLELIKNCYGKAHMLYAGDIQQNVFANGEDYAEIIKKTFPGKHYKKYELNVNYRSTKQISEFATSRSGRTNEVSCVREGDEPIIIKCGKDGVKSQVSAWIEKIRSSDYEHTCVLTSSKSEADKLLQEIDLPGDLPVGKLKFLPVYLAKGLEFDAVLLLNIDGEMEILDKKLNTNIFYTAATRAMHNLTVLE